MFDRGLVWFFASYSQLYRNYSKLILSDIYLQGKLVLFPISKKKINYFIIKKIKQVYKGNSFYIFYYFVPENSYIYIYFIIFKYIYYIGIIFIMDYNSYFPLDMIQMECQTSKSNTKIPPLIHLSGEKHCKYETVLPQSTTT